MCSPLFFIALESETQEKLPGVPYRNQKTKINKTTKFQSFLIIRGKHLSDYNSFLLFGSTKLLFQCQVNVLKYAHRLFHEPNFFAYRTGTVLLANRIFFGKTSLLFFGVPRCMVLYGTLKVRFVKKSMRVLYDDQNQHCVCGYKQNRQNRQKQEWVDFSGNFVVFASSTSCASKSRQRRCFSNYLNRH